MLPCSTQRVHDPHARARLLNPKPQPRSWFAPLPASEGSEVNSDRSKTNLPQPHLEDDTDRYSTCPVTRLCTTCCPVSNCCSAFLNWVCCQTSIRVVAWSQTQAQDLCRLSCLTAPACLSIDCTVCSLSSVKDAQSSLGGEADTSTAGTQASVKSWYGHSALPAWCCFLCCTKLNLLSTS